jgi:hypothetical protein
MNHVTDELELFALDALPAADRARVAEHLGTCPACREQARAFEEVAIALPDTLPQPDVPARVRARILATARGELIVPKTPRGTAWTAWLSPTRIALAALTAAVLVLGAVDIAAVRERDAAIAAKNAYADVALRVSHGGQNWYMAGRDQWAGTGGTLYSPGKPDAAAYVVFHDLPAISSGSVYALWLVDPDGHWQRAANFTPNGELAQAVILDAPVGNSTQCLVTVEGSREGRRAGPTVMQSRLFQ